MKRITIMTLVLTIALGLCACRMGGTDDTTPTTTEPSTTAPTDPVTTAPVVTDPIVIDPTIAPNVPDPSVDDDHLVDPTDGEDAAPKIRNRMNQIN